MAQLNRNYYPVEVYLREEPDAPVKRDYLNGQVYNMSGGSPEHSRIAVNLTSALDSALEGSECQVFNSDLKIGVKTNAFIQTKKGPVDEFVTYPDASIVCGSLEFFKDDRYTIANPVVVFEVLSPSTRNYDRSVKLDHYRHISTLQAYVMIDSERVWVDQYHRTGPNSWQVETPLQSLSDTLTIEALEIEISLSRIYRLINFGDEN